ncbi:unnamed protein product [Cylindrotheca closterium]|uniref:RING-type domain-containing protein n=1 Tax=Cylindrotheca closterium TaxID=2856 RepID=A0AAD2G620_9STRA|nr:unnamed protein product [Cylindrotheca closterium]
MEILVTLEPRDDPNEIIQSGLMQRKPLELRSTGATEIDLGRGSTTGIGDNTIGSSVVRIALRSSGIEMGVRATLQRDAVMCKVHVNGLPFPPGQKSAYLNSGDTISLDGLRYEYRVNISELSGSASAPVIDTLGEDLGFDSEDFWSTSSFLGSPHETKSEPGVNVSPTLCIQLSDELQCSICLDIQVNSRTIHPCGHSVCAACITKLSHCPQCRVKVKSHVPNMQLNSLISKLVSIPSLLDADDVKSYHDRAKNAKVFPVVELTSRSGTKRPRNSTGHRMESIPFRPPNGGGQRRTFDFAFGDMDDEFYMPVHLGEAAAAAATARAIASANISSNSRHPRGLSGLQQANRHRSGNALSSSRRSQPQLPSQAGNSVESAISID